MLDVTKFHTQIQDAMRHLRIQNDKREDMVQECYVALLENAAKLQEGIDRGEGEIYAWTICRDRMAWLNTKERRRKKIAPTDSLEDPKVRHRANKVLSGQTDVPDEKLYGAIDQLPFEEYRVVHSIYIEGRSQEQTAKDLGMSRIQVRTRSARGVELLRKIFEENG